MKFFRKLVTVLAIIGLTIWQYPISNVSRTSAGSMTGVTITGSSSVKSESSNYTIKFTPATTSSQGVNVNVSFQSPPDAQFSVGSATLGATSSSQFSDIAQIDAQWGNININAFGLTAGTEYTLVLNSITNPSKDGKYNVSVGTWGAFNTQVDSGNTSVTIGTVAVQGSVTLPDGSTGARGAYVEAQEKNNFSNRFGSPTSEDGSYGIGGLTSGSTYILNVWIGGGDPNSNTKGYVWLYKYRNRFKW